MKSSKDGEDFWMPTTPELSVNDVINGTSRIDWDNWDLLLWTPEQRALLEQGVIPREVHVAFGVLLTLIVIFGFTANSTILYIFSRFKRLRTPANVFIINLTICDFLACCLHPLAVYSAFRGRWSFGQSGCNLYGMGVAFFGLNSIVTLSAIACERYVVITSSSCRPVVAKWRITRRQAQRACAAIWLHCAALVSPPLLFGWSSYLPEGVLVTCSWDYSSRTLSNRLYYFYLLFFGFFLPVSVLTFCYAAIFRFILRSSREITRLITTSDGTTSFSKSTVSFRKRRRQTDVRAALIILSLAILCFTAWTPYTIVSLIGQFGPVGEDGQLKLSPMVTSIPAFLAKTAIVFDPLVYGFSSPQFRFSVRQILRQQSLSSSANGFRAGPNNMMMAGTRTAIQNSRSPRASSQLVFSSCSRSIRTNPKEPVYRQSSNDPPALATIQQCPQVRLSTEPDSNQQLVRGGLRKSCIKRNNSFQCSNRKSIRLREDKDIRVVPEEASEKPCLPQLGIVRNEKESHVFDQHQMPIRNEVRDAKGKPEKQRRSSEADLMRCLVKWADARRMLPVSTSFDR
ncbi:arthropsin4 [Daphnia sinensis]|uniref:Arthropsin4 n=1 Tax=Daphnia sinensis TaxID=1820382 RepID=A0AAD5L031_9CRUS|nr:arthropsin4 [Daphnia sinensis]